MTTRRKTYRLYMGLALVTLLPFAAAQAQTSEKPAPAGQPSIEVEQLKSKLDALVTLLEQQQRQMAELQKRIDAIDAKTKAASVATDLKPAALETAQTQRQEPSSSPVQKETKPADRPALLAGWDKNHAFFKSSDGRFETQVTGYGQLDWRGYESGNAPPNTFLVRRARLALEGKIDRYYDFKIEGDFADTASTPLRDLFVRVHRIDELMVSFGQFRVPISQEEIRTDSFQDFVERSMVNNLVPSRSPGVMASGIINKGVFEYQIGTFNGKGLLAANNNDTPESAIRLRFAPWKNGSGFWTKGLAFGGAYTQGASVGGASVRGRTESQSFTFYSPDVVNGQLNRANGEITWLLGPAAIRAEYDQTNQERENLGPNGTTLPGVIGKGYVAQFTYLLTGEPKPDAGAVTPKRNLFGDEPGGRGLGAWELKFRYANLQIANGTSKSNRADSFYFGPNWYLNRFVRYMLDFGIERFKDPVRTPKPGDRNFFVVLSRFQVAF
ncbi:MAG TPA: porin [Blastocatellia bacterium]|nr:porin [Blastocatellia bacterium]